MATLRLISLGCDHCGGFSGDVQAFFNGFIAGTVTLNCPGTTSYPAGTTISFLMSQPISFWAPASWQSFTGPFISNNPTNGVKTWNGPGLGGTITFKYQVT